MSRQLTLTDIEYLAHILAKELLDWKEPIPPFSTRFPDRLESCINTVSQTFGGVELYSTLLDKAAILFYLLIKNHPFQNGNKRIAVTALMVFLWLNDEWITTDTKKLYNFAKWVAESDPSLKDETISATKTFIRKNLSRKN